MAHDLDLAQMVVHTVWTELEPLFGETLVDPEEMMAALDAARSEVADLLDPDEEMDVEITDEEMERPNISLGSILR